MRTVLILEDNEKSLEMLAKIIKDVDDSLYVKYAVNMEEVYAASMKYNIDLFVIDIIWNPKDCNDVSGIKFADNIRKIKKYQYTPTVIITSLEDPKLYVYSDIHCYSYIEKPYDVDKVSKVIKDALNIPKRKVVNNNIFFVKYDMEFCIKRGFEKLYYAASDELIVFNRERRHDLKNHINAIYGMIYTTDNYDDLVRMQAEYRQYILDKNKETKLLLSAGNSLIAGFMYSKIKEAEKQGIQVKYKIKIEKTQLKVPEYKMVEMLGILFDNAIEALEIQESEKIVHVNIICINGRLDISVANRSEEFNYSKIEEFFYWNFSMKGAGMELV